MLPHTVYTRVRYPPGSPYTTTSRSRQFQRSSTKTVPFLPPTTYSSLSNRACDLKPSLHPGVLLPISTPRPALLRDRFRYTRKLWLHTAPSTNSCLPTQLRTPEHNGPCRYQLPFLPSTASECRLLTLYPSDVWVTPSCSALDTLTPVMFSKAPTTGAPQPNLAYPA